MKKIPRTAGILRFFDRECGYGRNRPFADRQQPRRKQHSSDCLGQKNRLFTGSERAEQRAAVIQTLLGTAKLNGLDPSPPG